MPGARNLSTLPPRMTTGAGTSSDLLHSHTRYDRLGRPTRMAPTEADGTAPEYPTVIDRPNLRETMISRGPGGADFIRVRRLADALGRLVETRRLDAGGCEAIRQTRYDVAGRVVFESEWGFDPACGEQEQAFDPARGTRFDRFADVSGARVHDPLGRVLAVTTADGKSTSQSYRGASLVLTADVAGRAASTYYEHDALGHLVRVDAPEGADARYAYDELDRLVRVDLVSRPPSGHPVVQSRALAYDGLGRLVSATSPEGGTRFFTRYDPSGRLLETIEPDGTRSTLVYDAAGRLQSTATAEDVTSTSAAASAPRLYASARPAAAFVYDEAGAGTLSRVESFDSAGRLMSRRTLAYEGPGGRLSEEATVFAAWDDRDGIDPRFDTVLRTCYFYDALGQLAETRYPAAAACERGSSPPGLARLVHEYSRGALVGLVDAGRPGGPAGTATPIISSVIYNAAGGLRKIVHGNGVTTDVVPDPMSRPGSITVAGPGGAQAPPLLRTGRYTFDGSGNIVSIGPADPSDPEGSTDRFDYDLASRLTAADIRLAGGAGGPRRIRLSYDFDDFGNLTRSTRTDTGPAGEAQTVTSTPADPTTNRLIALNGEACGHDARGNVLGDRAAAFFFDRRDRLVAAGGSDRTEPSGIYAYDAGGQRVMKVLPGSGARAFLVRDWSGRVLSEITLPPRRHDAFARRDYFHALGRVMGMAQDRAPAAVQGLESSMTFDAGESAEDPASWTLSLQWAPGAEPDLEGYRVYRRRAAETSWSLAGETSGRSFVQGGPQALQVLFYRVVAVDAQGREGPPSRSLRFVTAEGAPPSAPPGATVRVERHKRSLSLSWERMGLDSGTPDAEGNPATTFLGYNVYRREGSSPQWIKKNTRPLTQPSFHDLWATDPGIVYRYRVTVADTAGRESAGGAVGAGRPGDRSAPATPAGVRALSGPGAGEVTLVWDASAEPDLRRYLVYERQGASYLLRADVEAGPGPGRPRAHTLSGLAAGAPRTFAVAAGDADSESALSAPVTATPRTPEIAIPQQWAFEVYPWDGDSPSVVAVWDSTAGAASYTLHRKLDEEAWHDYRPIAVVSPPLERIVTDRSLDHCRSHTYVVRARDAAGNESPDPAWNMISRPMVRPVPPRAASTLEEMSVTISWDGLQGCAGPGSELQVLKWMVRTSQDPSRDVEVPGGMTSYTFRYPEGADVDLARPFAVYARLRDLRRHGLDPADPLAEFDSFLSDDLCASIAGGQVGGELSCADLSGNNPGGGGGGRPEPEVRLMRRLVPHFGTRRAAASWPEAAASGPGAPRAGGIAASPSPGSGDGSGASSGRTGPDPAGAALTSVSPAPPRSGGPEASGAFEFHWFHHDHLGSVRVVTDAAGNKIAEARYLPFGEEILGAGPAGSPYRFTGHERDDETALDYMLARYYSLATGRFSSPDPLDLAELVLGGPDASPALQQVLIEPARLNRYAYALGSPVSYADAGGMSPVGFGASIAAARALIRSYVAEARRLVARTKLAARLTSWVVAPVIVTAACATANPFTCTAGFLSAEAVAYRAAESLTEVFAIEAELVIYEFVDRLLDAALDAGARGDWDLAIALLQAAAVQARGLRRGPAAGLIMEIMDAIEHAQKKKKEEEERKPEPFAPQEPKPPDDPEEGPRGPGIDPLEGIGGWAPGGPFNPLSRQARGSRL